MAYRDELEAMRARLASMEAERDAARERADRLERAMADGGRAHTERDRFDPDWRSIPGGEPTSLTVRNESALKVEVLWLSHEGKERSAGTLVPGGSIRVQTYVGHCWRIIDAATGRLREQRHVVPGEATLVHEGAAGAGTPSDPGRSDRIRGPAAIPPDPEKPGS